MSDESKLVVRLEAVTTQLTKEMAKASSVVKQKMREIDDQLVKSNRKVSDGLVRSARSYSEGARGMSTFGRSVQNTSYQIGDFAVQVAGGTSATRAMAQQLPQLLGGFGVFGAVAGAAAAILIPLAGNLFGAVEPAQALKTAVTELNEAMGALRSADADANAPTEDLVAQYGAQAEQAKRVLDIKREIAALEAGAALGKAQGASAAAFGKAEELKGFSVEKLKEYHAAVSAALTEQQALVVANQNLGEIVTKSDEDALNQLRERGIANENAIWQLNEYRVAIAEITTAYGMTEEAAMGLAVAAAQVRDADTTEERSAATQAMAEYIYKATDGLKDASAETRVLYDQLLDAVKAGLDFSALNIAGPITFAAGEAARLATNLQAASLNYGKIQNRGESGPEGAQRAAIAAMPNATGTLASGAGGVRSVVAGSGGVGSGGGGGGGAAKEPLFSANDKKIQQIQREIAMLGQSAQAVASLQAKWELLDRAKKEGADLDAVQTGTGRTLRAEIDLQSEAVGRLTAEMAAQKINRDAFEKGIDGVASAMSQALLNGESLRAGLAEVFQGIAMDLMKSGIRQGLMSLVGGLGGGLGGGSQRGGGLGGLLGGLLGGMPSFDGGGSTGAGARSGGVDGKGGFPAILHPNEEIFDKNKGGIAGAGGAQRVEVEVFVRNDEIGAIARAAGMRGGQQAANAVRNEIPSIMDNHQKRRG
jgi:hypothetical protein